MSSPKRTLFYGTFVQTPATPSPSGPKHVLSINQGALWISNEDGRIEGFNWDVKDEDGLQQLIMEKQWVVDDGQQEGETIKVVRAQDQSNGFFFPGFIDTHIHASQYPNAGIFGSSTLLDWLETYTFPLESSFGDPQNPAVAPPKALTVYDRVVRRTLSHGTTCASYFATIHVPATNLLASLCKSRGQRAFVGRVCMDNPGFCPDFYRDESAEHSLAATEASIAYIRKIDPSGAWVQPIVTPRFAPTCTSDALSKLGKLVASTSPPLHIQTHISENRNEVKLVQELFPDSQSYAHVYDVAGLLTPRTILAHAVHLTAEERKLIATRQAKVSHCPASNSAIGSGLCPVRQLVEDGIDVGLGTDVSGGYSPSILEAARQACLVSRLVACESAEQTGTEKVGVPEVLYLATRGGAKVVSMEDQIGGFEVGKFWDAQMIELGPTRDGAAIQDVQEDAGNVDVFGWESWEEKIDKWVWSGDDRNVKAVWVNGRLVHERR